MWYNIIMVIYYIYLLKSILIIVKIINKNQRHLHVIYEDISYNKLVSWLGCI